MFCTGRRISGYKSGENEADLCSASRECIEHKVNYLSCLVLYL